MWRLLLRGIHLEAKTEAGKVNALLIVLTAALIMLLGSPLLEQVIRIWDSDYEAGFPVVPVLLILMAGGLVCVFLLVLLEPLLQERRRRRKD